MVELSPQTEERINKLLTGRYHEVTADQIMRASMTWSE